MDPIIEAARVIADARLTRTQIRRLPEELRPRDKEAAMRVQNRVSELLGRHAVAWKCSLPKPDRIPAAPIFDVYEQGRVPVVGGANGKIVEPEIAFVMARDLPPGREYSETEVREAVGEARLAVEVIGSRYSEMMSTDIHERVADHIVNESLVLGPRIPLEKAERLAEYTFRMSNGTGRLVEVAAKHPEGRPFPGLVWLANYLASQSNGLRKGDVVTTGSYAGFVQAPIGRELSLQFGDLGRVVVELVDGH